MHGHNDARKFETNADGRLQVHDIFFTVQGEGLFSGFAAVFIRLTGCNLKCWFCDTTWGDESDLFYSVDEIVDRVEQAHAGRKQKPLIVLTGGEPVRQERAGDLVETLVNLGYTVQVETAGTLWSDWLDQPRVHVCVSPKISRVHPNFELLRYPNVFWKYVLKAGHIEDDGLPTGDYQRHKNGLDHIGGRLARPPGNAVVYVTPMDETAESTSDEYGNITNYAEIEAGDAATKANYAAVGASAMRHGYVAQLQIHKLMELP